MPRIIDIVSQNLECPHGGYDSGVLAFNYPVIKSSNLQGYCEE